MFLSDAPSFKRLKILDINSGDDTKRKLLSMGIHPEDYCIKLSESNWGAILIQNISSGATKLALGRVLANKIIVEYEH